MHPIDKAMLADFIAEADGYLPLIRTAFQAYQDDSANRAVLEEAHRLAHTIKGAASMVGLTALSHAAYYLEECLEQTKEGTLALPPEQIPSLNGMIDLVHELLKAAAAEEPPPADWQSRIEELAAALLDAESLATLAAARPKVASSPAAPAPATPSPALAQAEPAINLSWDEVPAELREVFTLEVEEHFRSLDALLPRLRDYPDDKEIVQSIRRSAHTLKGTAAMVGFPAMTRLAHRMEDLLDQLFEGSRKATPEVVELLMSSDDALEDMVSGKAEATQLAGLYTEYEGLLGPVHEETEGESEAELATVTGTELDFLGDEAVAEAIAQASVGTTTAAIGTAAAPELESAKHMRVPLERLDDMVKLVSELIVARTAFEQRLADLLRLTQELQLSTERLGRVSGKFETQYEARTLASSRYWTHSRVDATHVNGNGNGHGLANGHERASPIPWRLEPERRDARLAEFDDLEFDRYTEFHLLTRELAETANDIQTVGGEFGTLWGDFESYLNRQAQLSSRIQDRLMHLRMVPFSALSARMHRTVRNVAKTQGKQVDLVLEGEKTELDKTVIDDITDALAHLLRNAVDHGIEPPDVRRVRGKPERGRITVRAEYSGTNVIVTIQDDGSGIDSEHIRATAVHNGVVSSAAAAGMNRSDLLQLLFRPGFSTAKTVSEVSGRGVGLDVVHAAIHKLKGSVSVESKHGQTTLFTLRLPLTLAVTRALLVKASQQVFAVPLSAVQQILRHENNRFERVGEEEVLRFGGRTYPVHWLSEQLRLRQIMEPVQRPAVLLLQSGDRRIALAVDDVVGGREIVIKGLGSHLRRVPGIMGTTLMGDGRVVLIVNPDELAERQDAGVSSLVVADARTPAAPRENQSRSVMIVDDSPSVRRILSTMVRKHGWNPTTAKDGIDALEALHNATVLPDVILLDIEMPRMDGYEFLATAKASPGYQNLPVIMLTSRAGEKHRRKAEELGANGYLVKPYQEEALLQLMSQVAFGAEAAVPQ